MDAAFLHRGSATHRIYAATPPLLSLSQSLCTIFSARAFGVADTGDGTRRGCSASAALQRLEEPCDRAGDSEAWGFAITVNGGDTIGTVVAVDLERGAPV